MQNVDLQSIKLTQTVKKGGCAAKLPAGDLKNILQGMVSTRPKELLIGTETMDDACAWDLGNGSLLIQTVDFFTPIVDDFFEFGAIAAANAISDVYAMGGTPKLALTILAYPTSVLPLEGLKPLMDGANKIMQEAGCVISGGHSIDDETLKLGFCVTGFVDKEKLWSNAKARVSDVLILTKPLGTGVVTTAIKSEKIKRSDANDVIESMMRLNKITDLLENLENAIHTATDITGFGLAGHGLQMASASNVTFEINCKQVPRFASAFELLMQGVSNRAHVTNRSYAETKVDFGSLSEPEVKLLCDAQTSGGLLLAVDEKNADKIVTVLKDRFCDSQIIGRVVPKNHVAIQFT